MSRRGNCWDKAVAESFFSTLKIELLHRMSYKTRIGVVASISQWIETFNNTTRMHSTLGYCSPTEYEKIYQTTTNRFKKVECPKI